MKNKNNNLTPLHPEDAIYKVKTFVNELQKVQNNYFEELVNTLYLTEEGQDWLHDYIYNSGEGEYDDFNHYLQEYKKSYEDLIQKDFVYNPAHTLLSTDFADYNPMMNMSSYEPELETAFPPAYNDAEPFSLKLDCLDSETSELTLSTISGINDTQN